MVSWGEYQCLPDGLQAHLMKFALAAKLLSARGIAWYCTKNRYCATHDDDLEVIPTMLALDPSSLPLEGTPGVANCQIHVKC